MLTSSFAATFEEIQYEQQMERWRQAVAQWERGEEERRRIAAGYGLGGGLVGAIAGAVVAGLAAKRSPHRTGITVAAAAATAATTGILTVWQYRRGSTQPRPVAPAPPAVH